MSRRAIRRALSAIQVSDGVFLLNYVGEVGFTEFPRLFQDRPIPWRLRSLQKLRKMN